MIALTMLPIDINANTDPIKRYTMEDLAKIVGVSKITISRALRDSPLVTPETRDKIKELAQQVGYRVNSSARNLRLQKNHMITVILEMTPDSNRPMSEPFPLQLLGGITQELTARGYSVLLTAMHNLSKGATATDGVILLGQGAHGSAVRSIASHNLPFVVWGEAHHQPDDFPATGIVVGSNNHQGGVSAAERFLALGRKNPWFMGDTGHAEVAERLSGFRDQLSKVGLTAVTLVPEAFTFGAGYEAVKAQMSKTTIKPDSLFAASDLLAMGAVRAFMDQGMHVPDVVSVIGYDDSPTAQSFVPPLTTVHQDWQRGGELLSFKILELVAGRPSHSEVLATRLVVRGT
jgi:DNA-binding LacI/PurR family transcriptional regulator